MKDEILKMISDYIGEDTSEEAIKILESVADALDVSIEDKEREIESLKSEVEDLKRKYIERFTKSEELDEVIDESDEDEIEIKETFEELFD